VTVTRTSLSLLAGALGVLGLAVTLNADPPRTPASGTPVEKQADERVPVAVARDRARLMHTVYAATLDSMHHHFFRRERAVLPARAMEDVFAEVDRQSKIKSRWIAVNTPAMSIHHEPKTAFEKRAAAELATGKTEFERVEDGYYLRAGSIPLTAGCVNCHMRFSLNADKIPRFAGLVISIPVQDE
jgi:cytochrome c553